MWNKRIFSFFNKSKCLKRLLTLQLNSNISTILLKYAFMLNHKIPIRINLFYWFSFFNSPICLKNSFACCRAMRSTAGLYLSVGLLAFCSCCATGEINCRYCTTMYVTGYVTTNTVGLLYIFNTFHSWGFV